MLRSTSSQFSKTVLILPATYEKREDLGMTKVGVRSQRRLPIFPLTSHQYWIILTIFFCERRALNRHHRVPPAGENRAIASHLILRKHPYHPEKNTLVDLNSQHFVQSRQSLCRPEYPSWPQNQDLMNKIAGCRKIHPYLIHMQPACPDRSLLQSATSLLILIVFRCQT